MRRNSVHSRPVQSSLFLLVLLTIASLLGVAGGCSSGGGTATIFLDAGDGAVVGPRDGSTTDGGVGFDSSVPETGIVDAAAEAGTDSATTDAATDGGALPILSVDDVSLNEGSAGTTSMTFTVTLSEASTQTVTVNYATVADGTATTSALIVGGADFTPTSGGLTFNPGDLSKTVTVSVIGDATSEPTETFSLTLSSATNATIGKKGTGTIVDDDAPPSVSVTDALLIEGNGGTTIASFLISLSAPSGNLITVHYKTTDGSATAAFDYAAIADTTLTFAPGETTKNVNVSVIGDLNVEANETFTLDLSSPTNVTIGKGQGIGTIQNDDGATLPTLTINDPTVTEGNAGSKVITFTVTLSASSGQTVTVDYQTSNGTATTANGDYQATGGPLTIGAGATSNTINVVVNGDTSNENDETFTIVLANAQNALIQKPQGTGTITNDDALPTVSIGNATVTEGQAGTGSMTFTVTLSAASGKTVTVGYASSDGTATSGGAAATGGQDYNPVNSAVTFPPGATSEQITVPIAGDVLNEANETLTVTLSNPGNATLGASSQGTGTITNDDPLPNLVIANASMSEGNAATSDLVFVVSLVDGSSNPAPSGRTVTVNYTTVNGSAAAGSDFTTTTSTLTFNPGQTQANIAVPIIGDVAAEPNETFTVVLSAPSNATITGGTGTGTITNDDGSLPFVNINDVSVAEGNSGTTQLTFNVTLSPAAAQTVTVDWASQNGTAVSGQDFAAGSGTVTFAAGETTKPVTINVSGDTLSELDEGLTVVLSNPSNNAVIQDGTGAGTITNDDAAPSVSITNATTTEGNAGPKVLNLTVTLSAVSGRTVTVAYDTADGTAAAAGPVLAGGSDYAAASGTLVFAPGETTKNVPVTINGDTTREDDETISVTLSGPVGATLGSATGTATITNDDAFPSISIANVTAAEGTPSAGTPSTTAFVFTVTMSGGYQGTASVRYSTANGTANQPADYTRINNELLTFLPGETVKTITVLVQKDATTEGNETFTVTITSAMPNGITIGTATATATITNDD